jgi:hypothetical protein
MVRPGRLEPHGLELGSDILGGEFLAACSRTTPFQQIISQKLDVRANSLRPYREHRRSFHVVRGGRSAGKKNKPAENSRSFQNGRRNSHFFATLSKLSRANTGLAARAYGIRLFHFRRTGEVNLLQRPLQDLPVKLRGLSVSATGGLVVAELSVCGP